MVLCSIQFFFIDIPQQIYCLRRRICTWCSLGNPPDIPIVDINKGTITEIVFSREHGLKVFDDIAIRTPGIARMDYWIGEVLETSANRISARFDSSNLQVKYIGGGSAVKHDKTKLYDAYNLIISDIRHMMPSMAAIQC